MMLVDRGIGIGLAAALAAVTLAIAALPTTQLASQNATGTASGNGGSFTPELSRNGRFVAFQSDAPDLVTNDSNSTTDAFVRDLRTGTTTLLSVNAVGTTSGNSFSAAPVVSANGRFVAFQSGATDLVTLPTGGLLDVYVRDLRRGITMLASVNSTGTEGANDESFIDAISGNGRLVLFQSDASDLVSNDANSTTDVFVRDVRRATTLLVSANAAGTSTGNSSSSSPVVTPNGRFVAFGSAASDLVLNDGNGNADVFVRDLRNGTTILVSVNAAGTASASGHSIGPVMSKNGRFVAFASNAGDLVTTTTNGVQNVFVRDLHTGTNTLVSVNAAGTAGGNGTSQALGISVTGRFVLMESLATDLVGTTDGNGTLDIFVRDLKSGTTTLVSVNGAGTGSGDAGSFDPMLSANGRFVAFESAASDLAANDGDGEFDVFVRDMRSATTMLASVNAAGTSSGNSASGTATLSANGQMLAFESEANDLTANDTNGAGDVFVRPTR